MIINSIIQVNIGYIPGYNCSKDRKTHHPLCRWCVFLSGGLGGVALLTKHRLHKGYEEIPRRMQMIAVLMDSIAITDTV